MGNAKGLRPIVQVDTLRGVLPVCFWGLLVFNTTRVWQEYYPDMIYDAETRAKARLKETR